MSDVSKEQQWRERIDTCINSGMSIKGWCKANQVSSYQYHYWKKKFKAEQDSKKHTTTGWAPLIIHESHSEILKAEPIILQVETFKIEINEGFNKQTLKEVLQILGDLC